MALQNAKKPHFQSQYLWVSDHCPTEMTPNTFRRSPQVSWKHFFLLTTKTPVRKILRAGKIEPYSLWSLGEFRNLPMSQENTLFQNYALHGCCLHLLIIPCIIGNLSNVQEANGTQGEHVRCLWRSSRTWSQAETLQSSWDYMVVYLRALGKLREIM